jgi:hypothetical protein
MSVSLRGLILLLMATVLVGCNSGNSTPKQSVPATESPPPDAPVPEPDLLQVGSSWKGEGRYTFMAIPGGAQPQFVCALNITKRNGNEFRGTYSYRGGSVAIEGSVDKTPDASGKWKVHWESISDLAGNAHARYPMIADGILAGPELTMEITQTDPATREPRAKAGVKFKLAGAEKH